MSDAPTPQPQDMARNVTFHNARGERLAGLLMDTGSQEIVILCHGMKDNKTAVFWPHFAEALVSKNLSSLRFDFSGNGDSEGEFRYGNIKQEAEDIRAAVEYVRSLRKNVSAIAGHSKAGSGVLCYSAKYQDVPRVINISGRLDQQTGVTERFGEDIFERLEKEGSIRLTWHKDWVLTREDMRDRLELDMTEKAKAIPTSVHVLTIHGTEDATIPVSAAHDYARLISHHDLHIVQGADHAYRNPEHRNEMIAQAINFISR